MSHNVFLTLFNQEALKNKLIELGYSNITIYGEAYGGKEQKMSATYGEDSKFIVFDIKENDKWLTVPEAAQIAEQLDLQFVDYHIIPLTKEALDAERELPSTQAARNGMGIKRREGIVIRPLQEKVDEYGERVIGKHKNDEFIETAEPRELGQPQQFTEAQEIAKQYVVPMRLDHVLDKLPGVLEQGTKAVKTVIDAMIEDVLREGEGEIIITDKKAEKIIKTAIGKETALLFKKKLEEALIGEK